MLTKRSLAGAKDKIAKIDATLRRRASSTELGMPSFERIAGRSSPAITDAVVGGVEVSPKLRP